MIVVDDMSTEIKHSTLRFQMLLRFLSDILMTARAPRHVEKKKNNDNMRILKYKYFAFGRFT